MDKKTAFKILNLETTVSFEEAKKAYRNLAKKYHPDIVANESGSNCDAEAKMKEINLAFRYLAPHLKSKKPVKKTHKKKKSIKSEKLGMTTFLSKIFGSVLTAFRGKRSSRSFENKFKNEKPLRKTRSKKVRFDDVFKTVYRAGPDKQRKIKKSNSYHSYQKYMALKRKIKSGHSRSNQDMSIGRIEKINPVKPVESVKRD